MLVLVFSCRVMTNSFQHHRPQRARLPCPSLSPRVCSNSCPLSLWCHPTISSSVLPFSSCLRSFPASGSFPMSQFFTRWPKDWSFSFSISPSNEHSEQISFRIGRFDLLAVQGTQESSPAPQFKSINPSVLSFLHSPALTSMHDHWKIHRLYRLGQQSNVSAF